MMTKYEYLVMLLYEYFYRQQIYRDNDVVQLSNNVQFRKADPLDHLEMIMAQVRAQVTTDISRDVYKLVAISKGGRYNG